MTVSPDSDSIANASSNTEGYQLNDAWFVSLPDVLKQALNSIPDSEHYFVALSGGLDSSLLAVLAHRYLLQFRHASLTAIHVHHGISQHADSWQKHCEDICKCLGIELIAQQVSLKSPKKGVEEAARSARYGVFESVLPKGGVLLQGHHQNDQAETVLLRLMRGAGVTGMAGIPRTRSLNAASIHRPFLDVSKELLLKVAEGLGLSWVEDDSNVSREYDRNFVRHDVIPVLESRWRGAVSRLAMSANHCRESSELEDALAQIDIADMTYERFGSALSITKLARLSMSRQHNVVRYWLRQLGMGFPGEKRFLRIWAELLPARDDANPMIEWSQGVIRRYSGLLYALPQTAIESQARFLLSEREVGFIQAEDVEQRGAGAEHNSIKRPTTVVFDENLGGQRYSLRIVECGPEVDYLSTHDTPLADGCLMARLPSESERVVVKFRQGGELFRPAGKAHHRPLKKHFHDHNVPPWLRDSVPLLYYNDSLVAVGQLLVAEGFQPQGESESLEIKWC